MQSTVALLVSAAIIHTAYSLCNTCSTTTHLACVDRDKFKVCVDGLPSPPVVTCPAGTVCTSNAQVCGPASTSEPACNSCETCDPTKVFACTGFNAFALCLGQDEPDKSTIYTCPDDLVCNVESPQICIDRKIAGIGSSCPWTSVVTTPEETETTTPISVNPGNNPDEFCKLKQSRGRYEILSDNTCTQYINCYQSGGQWYGNAYYCPLSTYFNAATQVCGRELPARCNTAVAAEICD